MSAHFIKWFYLLSFIVCSQARVTAQPGQVDRSRISNLFSSQNYEGLIEYLSPEIDSGISNTEILGYLGYANFMLGNFRGSEIYFQRILDDSPENLTANRFLASIYLQLNPDEAEKYLRKLVSLEPRSGQAYRDLGDLNMRRNEVDSAFYNYQMGYLTEPKIIKSVARFAGALLNRKNYRRADSILSVAGHTSDSLNPVFLRLSLQTAYESKNYPAAIIPGEKLILIKESSGTVLNQLLISYYILKKYDACIRTGEYLRLIKTANELTLFYESQAYAGLNRYDSSSDLLKDCLTLAISPSAEACFYNLAQNSERSGRFKEALTYYDTAYYFFKNPMMLYNKGRVYETFLKNPVKADLFFKRFKQKADTGKADQRQALEYVRRRFRSNAARK